MTPAPNGNFYGINYLDLVELTPTGDLLRVIATLPNVDTGSSFPYTGITVAPGGDLLVSVRPVDEELGLLAGRIERYDPATGALLGVFANALTPTPRDLTIGPDGNVYVAQYEIGSPSPGVYRYDGTTGAALGSFASGTAFSRNQQRDIRSRR